MSPTLPHARYIVLTHEGVWKINLNNTARKASEGGYPASVLLMKDATNFETIWSSVQG